MRLEIDGNFLYGVRSSELNFERDMIETTTYESDFAKEYIPGEKGATFSAEILYDDSTGSDVSLEDLYDTMDAGTEVAFVYGIDGSIAFTGKALIQSLAPSADKNDSFMASVTFLVTGKVRRDIGS